MSIDRAHYQEAVAVFSPRHGVAFNVMASLDNTIIKYYGSELDPPEEKNEFIFLFFYQSVVDLFLGQNPHCSAGVPAVEFIETGPIFAVNCLVDFNKWGSGCYAISSGFALDYYDYVISKSVEGGQKLMSISRLKPSF